VEELVTFCSGMTTRLAVTTTSPNVNNCFSAGAAAVVAAGVAIGVTAGVSAGTTVETEATGDVTAEALLAAEDVASCAQSPENEMTAEKIEQRTTRLKIGFMLPTPEAMT
jgi:hypothetical protein